MIALIEGHLKDLEIRKDGTAKVLVLTSGVGYELMIGAHQAQELPPLGTFVSIRIFTYMREGTISLYGFRDRAERAVFELLLGTHGVGPALAMSILGSLTMKELVTAVESGDVKMLTMIPGVGTKTAQRLIIELAQRIDGIPVDVPNLHGGSAFSSESRSEVIEALTSLGYGTDEIRLALRTVSNAANVDELLRAALVHLAPHR